MDRFEKLLKGAHEVDEHFRSAPFEQNIPVIMALCWASGITTFFKARVARNFALWPLPTLFHRIYATG